MKQQLVGGESMSRNLSERIEVGLSAKGLINVPRNVYENDFTLIVDDSHYKCPSVFAAFLSRRIGSLQSIDPTIREFHISTKDPHKYFSRIVDLCSGLVISIDLEDKDFSRFIGHICGELLNGELYEQINGAIEGELTISLLWIDFNSFIELNQIMSESFHSFHHIFSKLTNLQFVHYRLKFFVVLSHIVQFN
jgi:hypothetical protein